MSLAKYCYSFFFIFFCFLFSGCEKRRESIPIIDKTFKSKEVKLTEEDLKYWFLKDIIEDTIPGISLQKAIEKIIKEQIGEPVVIAMIDGEVDVFRSDIQPYIWVNKKEIPNNGIDDDENGYIDDVHGWNFIGAANGDNVIYTNFETTRILRKYKETFEQPEKNDTISESAKSLYRKYLSAKKHHENQLRNSERIFNNALQIKTNYQSALDKIEPYLLEKDFTGEKLDSLLSIYSELEAEINLSKHILSYGQDMADIHRIYNDYKARLEYMFNPDYDEREIIGDNPDDINDIKYGNNRLSENKSILYHGTLVAGVLTSILEATGVKNIKIMPLCISGYGDEHDKDIALAIRYAVDNGANIINISSGKDFSLYEEWVQAAIQYAEVNDVLVITSAGNGAKNLDMKDINDYPNDTDYNGREIVSNFIKVGASGYDLNENINATFSNYGQNEVDIFAPGVNIYTASATNENGFEFTEGTSVAAPMVSGIAALLKSYYPHLTAKELKEIILQSGVDYRDNCVTVLDVNDEKVTVPFNLLSKSGKIINAYNAFLTVAR